MECDTSTRLRLVLVGRVLSHSTSMAYDPLQVCDAIFLILQSVAAQNHMYIGVDSLIDGMKRKRGEEVYTDTT